MNLRYRDNRVVVFDDFLASDDQHELLRYLDCAKFRRVLPDAWGRAFRLTGGEPLVGIQVVSEDPDCKSGVQTYPTQTALDIIVRRVSDCQSDIADIVGARGHSWTYFTVCPYVYPAEAGLGWHTDGHCAGGYIYYAHAEWRAQWGGELIVAYSEGDCAPYAVSNRGILRNELLDHTLRHGLGYYFAPLPNRIIFLRSGTAHMIKAVDRAAGDNLRLSISGFFLDSDSHAKVAD